MVDKEIIKALEMCLNFRTECDGCSYETTRHCHTELKRDALDLIKNQHTIIEQLYKVIDEKSKHIENIKAEKNKLMDVCVLQSKQVDELQAEIKWLKEALQTQTDILESGANSYEPCFEEDKIRAEAIKEFAEKLKTMLAKYDMYGTLYIVEDIYNIVKEMGADNDS